MRYVNPQNLDENILMYECVILNFLHPLVCGNFSSFLLVLACVVFKASKWPGTSTVRGNKMIQRAIWIRSTYTPAAWVCWLSHLLHIQFNLPWVASLQSFEHFWQSDRQKDIASVNTPSLTLQYISISHMLMGYCSVCSVFAVTYWRAFPVWWDSLRSCQSLWRTEHQHNDWR